MPRTITITGTGAVAAAVTSLMTAARFAEGDGEQYPEVLASPVMIGQMERACAQLIQPVLAGDEMSVGVRFDITHLAPTPVGLEIVCEARFEQTEGGLLWFAVTARDPAGEIGRGRHARAIVSRQAIESRAAARRAATLADGGSRHHA